MSPSRSIKVSIEGPRAEAATRDLFSKGWFEAEWERRPEEPSAPSSVVSAQLVAIAGGSVTTADKVLGWWESWRKAEEATGAHLEVVLEGPSGARVALASASRDSLVDVLRLLHNPPR
jgi:hypothetical protein